MRRAALVLAVTLLVAAAVPAHAEAPLETSARASIVAAVLDAQPAFDPALVDSRAARSNIGRSSLNSVVWPSFLADAFFFLYGFQSVERVALGISEARSPQGPERERATLSDLAFANGGDASLVPGAAGRSESRAVFSGAHGVAAVAEVSLPGGVVADGARSTSSVAGAVASAEQSVAGLVAGPLRVASLRGRARVADGVASSSLDIVDATVAGVPVRIDREGARAATDPLQERVDEALAGSGVQVRLLPSRSRDGSSEGEASSGGMLVEARVVAQDPSGTPRDVKVGYVFGAARAAVSVGAAGDVVSGPAPDGVPSSIDVPVVDPVVGAPAGPPAAGSGGGPLVRRRFVVTDAAAGLPASARGAYGGLMLLGLSLLLVRPLVRASARP